ncbi:hypothetical protein AALA44_03245 [Enterococcus ratti]
MITLSKLLFWVPFIGIILFMFFFTKWNKFDLLLLVSSFPSLYFIVKIIEYSYAQPAELFKDYLKGLIISSIFYLFAVFLITKKR